MLNYGRRSEDPATGRHSRSSRSADSEDDRPLLSRTEQPKEGNPNQVRLDENSPLLEGQKPDDEETLLAQDPLGQSLTGQEEGTEETKSMWYLFVLTLSIGGLQIAWATELSNGSPFLLSLGLSKALLSFVWIAGPLTGVLVQPYVGMLSDRSRMSWGKRRPFMIAGSTGTILSLLALAWSRELVGGFLSLFGADPASQGIRTTTIIFAVAWVYILDFSINAGSYLALWVHTIIDRQ
jgi:solute carrier family 45 protein 1/2/4